MLTLPLPRPSIVRMSLLLGSERRRVDDATSVGAELKPMLLVQHLVMHHRGHEEPRHEGLVESGVNANQAEVVAVRTQSDGATPLAAGFGP